MIGIDELLNKRESNFLKQIGLKLAEKGIHVTEKLKRKERLFFCEYVDLLKISLEKTTNRKYTFWSIVNVLLKKGESIETESFLYNLSLHLKNGHIEKISIIDFDVIRLTSLLRKINNALKINHS